jgi:hypothetical protein
MYSYILNFILNFFFKSIIGQFVGIAVAVLAAIGLYFYAYHLGYVSAQKICHDQQLQALIDAKNIELNNLKKQLDAAQPAINTNNNKRIIVVRRVIQAKQVVNNEVKDNTSCDLGADVVGVLNNVRAANSNK